MEWIKKGKIYTPAKSENWQNNSALQPTPLILHDRIRVYVGFRDQLGISRIGYVDLGLENPKDVIKVSHIPVLDIGEDGMFDENGVVPTCVVKRDTSIYLYYAGYALGHKVRFQVFTGLAESTDGGETFKRIQKIPITERAIGEELFRVIHSTIFDDGVWKTWYGAGNRFDKGEIKTLPRYDIRYMESKDGINFPSSGELAIRIPKGSHRVGRPFVFKENKTFKLFYGIGSEKIPYQLAYAESNDGKNWEKREIDLRLSAEGWDSQMMAYPAFVRVNGKCYLFYNGNDYGRDGFGYAELIAQ